MSESITKTQSVISKFLEVVEGRIETSATEGKNLPATRLAKELAPDFGWEWPQAYHLINIYLRERPELTVGLGPKGGIKYVEGQNPYIKAAI